MEEEEEETGGSGANTSIYLAASEGLGVSVSDEGEIGFAFLRQTQQPAPTALNCRPSCLGGKSDDSVAGSRGRLVAARAIWAKSASAPGHDSLDKSIPTERATDRDRDRGCPG